MTRPSGGASGSGSSGSSGPPGSAIDERTRARHAAVHGLLRQGVVGDRELRRANVGLREVIKAQSGSVGLNPPENR